MGTFPDRVSEEVEPTLPPPLSATLPPAASDSVLTPPKTFCLTNVPEVRPWPKRASEIAEGAEGLRTRRR